MKLKLTYLFVWIFSQVALSQTNKQPTLVKSYTTEDGLIANPISHIFQDSKGFMWFSTWHGISQYDGNRFTNYNTDNGLSHNSVTGIFEEADNFYVYMPNGILDIINQGHITQNVVKERLEIIQTVVQNDGTTFATTNEKGIIKVKNGITNHITKPLPGSTSDFIIIDNSLFLISGVFYDDSRDNPLRNIYSYLLLTDEKGNVITYLDATGKSYISRLYRDTKGRIWACSENGLMQFQISKDKATGKYSIETMDMQKPFDHPALKSITNDILEDRNGNLWIATLEGLIRISADGTLEHFSMDNILSTNRISCIFEDREGNVWVGTNRGVLKFPINGQISRYTIAEGLADNELQDVITKGNHIWFTTQNGFLQKLDSKTKKVETVVERMPSHYQFLRMGNGKTYIGQGDKRWSFNEIVAFDPENGHGEVVLRSDKPFFTAEMDSLGNFFLGTREGVYVYDRNKNGHFLNTVNHRVTSLMLDQRGYLWTSTFGGGLQRLKLSYDKNKIQAITEDMGHLFSADIVQGLFTDLNGSIWVGSLHNGVAKLTLKDDGKYIVMNYNTAIGLTSLSSTVACQTNDGGVLLKSSLGIDKITQDGRIFNFSKVNHLFEEIRTVSPMDDGTFWIATASGLIHYKNQHTETLPPPPVYITKVALRDSVLYDPNLKKALSLKYNENNLNIEYATPTFINEKAMQYSYRLLGSSAEEWSNPALNNEVSFAGLKPNHYTFEVRVLGLNGQWGLATTFPFTVRPPWYATNLSKIVYLLLVALILYGIYRYLKFRWDVKKKLQWGLAETERLKSLDEFKTKLYTNISHEFRTPLTLISGPIDNQLVNPKLNKKDKKELVLVKQNADRLLNLVDQMLNLSMIDSQQIKLKVSEGNLSLLLKQIVSAFQYKADEKNIAVMSTIQDLKQIWFDRDIIEKITSNLLSNAIKYAPNKSTVVLDASRQENSLVLSVINISNQVGKKDLSKLFQRFYQDSELSEGVGVGLALVRELVTLSRGTIIANNIDTDKIQFTVTLPITRTAYNTEEIDNGRTIEDENEKPVNHTRNTNKNKPVLLIVEDEPDMLAFIVSIFIKDYQIIEAPNGKTGIEKAQKQLPDLIISDVMMPEQDGIELCHTIKTNELTSHIPVILLTAKVGEQTEIEGFKTGADAYVTKPFNTKKLKIRVEKLIESRLQLLKHFSKTLNINPELAITSTEAAFLKRLKTVLDEHITNPEFNSERFAKLMLISRAQLHLKLKAITNMTTSEFIRSQRLKLAIELLQKSDATISEIAYQVGFNTPSYFIKCFKETYGCTPNNYL